jgi:hypothetical protein
MQATTSVPSRVAAAKIRHFVGERPTRVTYQGIAEFADGSRSRCPHHEHRTQDAAWNCARKLRQDKP